MHYVVFGFFFLSLPRVLVELLCPVQAVGDLLGGRRDALGQLERFLRQRGAASHAPLRSRHVHVPVQAGRHVESH